MRGWRRLLLIESAGCGLESAGGEMRGICWILLVLGLSAACGYGQEGIAGFGPLDPAPPKDMTAQQMIDKFAARESVFKKARDQYAFRQTVKVDTLEEDTNKVDGEYQQITDISFTSDGRRQEHVVFAPQNSLQRVMMSPDRL